MDWRILEKTARKILEALARFSGPVDTGSLLNLTHDQDQSWPDSPGTIPASYQALEFIDVAGLANMPDGYGWMITTLGRELISSPDSKSWDMIISNPKVDAWAETEELIAASTHGYAAGLNTFRRLELHQWRQFRDVEIDFHPRLTILTGANGAGKTTLLSVLAPHFSWDAQLVSSKSRNALDSSNLPYQRVGTLTYANGARTTLQEPATQGIQLSALSMPSQQAVPGIYISSHRSISSYRPLQNLPARFSTADALLGQFASEIQSRFSGQSSQFPPLYRMKEALVAAAMYGYGNAAVVAIDEARAVWDGFQDVLRRLLPSGMAFERLLVEDGDVLIRTNSAQFPIEAVSGGVSAMLELAWQIFLRGRASPSFTVCIDEPENHLHPELQRAILPALLDAFPTTSFVVATHSPFVVTSSNDCSVYALRPNYEGKVTSRLVNEINHSGTSDETLMSVLGLDTPLPLWAERKLSEAASNLPPNPTADNLRVFRQQLIDAGLGDQFSASLSSLDNQKSNDQD